MQKNVDNSSVLGPSQGGRPPGAEAPLGNSATGMASAGKLSNWRWEGQLLAWPALREPAAMLRREEKACWLWVSKQRFVDFCGKSCSYIKKS